MVENDIERLISASQVTLLMSAGCDRQKHHLVCQFFADIKGLPEKQCDSFHDS